MDAVTGKHKSALQRAEQDLKPRDKIGIANVFWEFLIPATKAKIMERAGRIAGDSDTAITAMLLAYGDIHYPGAEPEDVAVEVGTRISMNDLLVEDFLAEIEPAFHE